MRVVLPEVVSILLVGALMACAGVGFALEKGLSVAAHMAFFAAGFCVGYAVTFAMATREKDEELRQELLAEARTLTQAQKEHFGGFRRHE